MLLREGKIARDMIALLDKRRYTGFNVYAGSRILPRHETSLEQLARYILRASFYQERLLCHIEAGELKYRSKDGLKLQVFDALGWHAAICCYMPEKGV